MNAVIVDCLRTAIGKAPKGSLRNTRPDDLAATVIRQLLAKYPAVTPAEVDDVILGCANPEGESGMNMARIAAMRAGLPDAVPGVTINRFCSSGLQAIAMAADRIRAGGAQIIIAGGAESMSMIPMAGYKFAPNPWMVDHMPQIYMGMGLTAEAVQRKYGVGREESDKFAYRSHQNALRAQSEGRFDEEIVPVEIESNILENGVAHTHKTVFAKDEGPRADTSVEALGKLKAVFQSDGTVTAGNSSQTSDGAAAALVMSEKKAKELGLKPMARFVSFAVAGVPPRDHGHRARGRDPQGAGARGTEDRRHRRNRIERSIRRPGPGRDRSNRPSAGPREPEWRRDCIGASPGMHRRQAHCNDPARNETPES